MIARPAESSRVAFATSELAPWSKVGGLGDVSAALPPALAEAGHDVRVFVPHYDTPQSASLPLQPVDAVQQVPLEIGGRFLTFNLLERVKQRGEPETLHEYFVQCAPVFERGQIYTLHEDEHVRFVVLCRAVLESCQRLQWAPDVVHANDWFTALLPIYLRTLYAWDELFEGTRTVLTIHNLGYQGVFGAQVIEELGIAGSEWRLHQEDLAQGTVNLLKTGLLWADELTTVSPTYAREIQTQEYGHGLHELLQQRADDLVGILNGVDVRTWDPRHDPLIPYRYSERSLWRKKRNKISLLERSGLELDPEAPVLGSVTRLTVQKGMGLAFGALPPLLEETDLRWIVLGSGEAEYEDELRELALRFPEQVRLHQGFDEGLAHHIEAGSDLFLMPSLYEPCGLNQMYSQRYGTLPVVRRTGGLADTVEDFDPATGDGTGFVFDEATPVALQEALQRALDQWQRPENWRRMMLAGMALDWSWRRRADEYAMVYRSLQVS